MCISKTFRRLLNFHFYKVKETMATKTPSCQPVNLPREVVIQFVSFLWFFWLLKLNKPNKPDQPDQRFCISRLFACQLMNHFAGKNSL